MRALTAALLLLAAPPAEAGRVLRTVSGAVAHWKVSDIKVALDPRAGSRYMVLDDVEEALAAAQAAWNALPEMRARFVPLTTAARPDVVVRFCRERWQDAAGLLARTTFRADPQTGAIGSALIEINECDFRFLAPDELRHGRYDLQSVLTHELGHVLGLGHSDDRTAVMFADTGTGRQRRPGLDDRAGLAVVYGLPPPVATDPAPAPLASSRPRLELRAAPSPPAGTLAAVRVDAPGLEATVYFGEPTILPALADATAPAEPRRSPRAARRGRNAR